MLSIFFELNSITARSGFDGQMERDKRGGKIMVMFGHVCVCARGKRQIGCANVGTPRVVLGDGFSETVELFSVKVTGNEVRSNFPSSLAGASDWESGG